MIMRIFLYLYSRESKIYSYILYLSHKEVHNSLKKNLISCYGHYRKYNIEFPILLLVLSNHFQILTPA